MLENISVGWVISAYVGLGLLTLFVCVRFFEAEKEEAAFIFICWPGLALFGCAALFYFVIMGMWSAVKWFFGLIAEKMRENKPVPEKREPRISDGEVLLRLLSLERNVAELRRRAAEEELSRLQE